MWSEVAQSCPTLCNPMDCSLPGSSVHGIFQAGVLEWIAISFSRRSSQPKDQTWISHTVDRRLTVWATRELDICIKCGKIKCELISTSVVSHIYLCVCMCVCEHLSSTLLGCAKSLQSCLTLCDPMDCSPPDSSVHRILQAIVLERIAIPSSRRSSHVIEPMSLTSPAFAGGFLTTNAIWEVLANFNYTKVLSIIIIMLYIRSSDLIYFITESL